MLAILFIGLKLANIIHWSWWLVLAPLWAPAAFILGIATLAFLAWLLCLFVAKLLTR
jgi:hypothetical protein